MEQTFPHHVDLPPLHWVKVYWKEPSAFIDDEHSRECTMFHFGIYRHSKSWGFPLVSAASRAYTVHRRNFAYRKRRFFAFEVRMGGRCMPTVIVDRQSVKCERQLPLQGPHSHDRAHYDQFCVVLKFLHVVSWLCFERAFGCCAWKVCSLNCDANCTSKRRHAFLWILLKYWVFYHFSPPGLLGVSRRRVRSPRANGRNA